MLDLRRIEESSSLGEVSPNFYGLFYASSTGKDLVVDKKVLRLNHTFIDYLSCQKRISLVNFFYLCRFITNLFHVKNIRNWRCSRSVDDNLEISSRRRTRQTQARLVASSLGPLKRPPITAWPQALPGGPVCCLLRPALLPSVSTQPKSLWTVHATCSRKVPFAWL